jgi:O-acetyl-ADP-ribose deacetylase (regulator of RNase III)
MPGYVEFDSTAKKLADAERSRSIDAMAAKFNGADEAQKHTLRVQCLDGTTQEINLFVSTNGDPVHEPTEMLVNAANPDIVGGGGICGAIYGMYQDAGHRDGFRSLPGFPLGKRLSPGEVFCHCGPTPGKLPFYVVQAAGPDNRINQPIDSLGGCYEGIVKAAAELGTRSITQACISANIYRHDPQRCAAIAVSKTVEAAKKAFSLRQTAGEPVYVWFSIYMDPAAGKTPRSFEFYKTEFAKLKHDS